MKRIAGFALATVLAVTTQAQAPKEKAAVPGRQVVDKLCGCFEVSFKYAETFSPDPAYKFHDREEIGGTAEMALPIEISDKKIVIQHLLVVSPTVVVKHWREGRNSHPQLPPIQWKRKPLAALASMAVVKFQLQRLSRGRKPRPEVSAVWALILDRLYIGRRTRQYRQAMGK